MKRDLHTLFIKYDSDFQTLSKIALSQLILKIIYFHKIGTGIKHIISQINTVIVGSVSRNNIENALNHLKNEKKVNFKSGKYYVHEDIKSDLELSVNTISKLLDKIINKYFSKAETPEAVIRDWFQDVTISFFRNYSFEWFRQITTNGKKKSTIHLQNLEELFDDSIDRYQGIKENDQKWLASTQKIC